MNRNKFVKIALVVSFVAFIITPVFAVPPEPTPICQIEGTIKFVEFKDAYNEPCLSQPNGCPPSDRELQHPARYFFDVNINSVSYISGITDFNTCENMYPVDSVQTIYIDKDKVKLNDLFPINKEIEGVVKRSLLGSSFDSYNLKDEAYINKSIIQESLIFFFFSPLNYLFLALFILVLLLLITFVYAGIRAAPWVPTRGADVKRVLKLIDLKSVKKMYELGCGDGRIVCAFSEKGVNSTGFEISLFPYIIAKIRRLFIKNKKNCKILYRDFWGRDLSDADAIYFFLMPKPYSRLKSKLEKELKKGTKVLAYVWPIEGWEPLKVDKKKGFPNLYLYRR